MNAPQSAGPAAPAGPARSAHALTGAQATEVEAKATGLSTWTDLGDALASAGAAGAHARAALACWLSGGALARFAPLRGAPERRTLRAGLAVLDARLDGLCRERERCSAPDGSARLRLELASGRAIESVLLPRGGLCVSSQVGCAVGCGFCSTGRDGLLQQLTPLEILAQVVHARRERAVRRVVFMGMGEPAHNLEAVLAALTALGTWGRLPHKNLVVSSVGEPSLFERLLRHDVRPALALSLHTLDAARRAALLPRAPRVEPALLLERALEYADRTTYPLLVQWTLLAGETDDPAELGRLAEQLRGRRALVNLIPFNAVAASPWRRPPLEHTVELVRALKRNGVFATLRDSAAQDVLGGCGQLVARRDPSPHSQTPASASSLLP